VIIFCARIERTNNVLLATDKWCSMVSMCCIYKIVDDRLLAVVYLAAIDIPLYSPFLSKCISLDWSNLFRKFIINENKSNDWLKKTNFIVEVKNHDWIWRLKVKNQCLKSLYLCEEKKFSKRILKISIL